MKINEFGVTLKWKEYSYFNNSTTRILPLSEKITQDEVYAFIKEVIHEVNHYSGVTLWFCLHGKELIHMNLDTSGGLIDSAKQLYFRVADFETLKRSLEYQNTLTDDSDFKFT